MGVVIKGEKEPNDYGTPGLVETNIGYHELKELQETPLVDVHQLQ